MVFVHSLEAFAFISKLGLLATVLEPRWGSWVSRFDGSQMKPTRCDWKIASDVFNQCMKLPGAKSYGNIIDLIGSALPLRLVNTKNTLSSFYLVLKFQNKCTLTNYSELLHTLFNTMMNINRLFW